MKKLMFCCLLIAGCSKSGYFVVDGPATFHLDNTLYTPGLNVNIDEGGRFLMGPDMPEFYVTEPEAEPVTPPA
jgi:hypothetical protein